MYIRKNALIDWFILFVEKVSALFQLSHYYIARSSLGANGDDKHQEWSLLFCTMQLH